MNNKYEDEDKEEKLKEYKRILEGLESLFTEFQNINKNNTKKIIKKKIERKITIKKDINPPLEKEDLNKLLLQSDNYKGKLTLLDERQAFDENESYQKIIDLFIEENESIPEIERENGDPDKYILTQLFTAFSLLERKIYLNSDKSLEEKARNILKFLNSIKFNKDSKLTPQMLEYFNHNILKIEDIFQSNENEINSNKAEIKRTKEELNDKKPQVIEAKEFKKRLDNDKIINTLDSINEYGNVILNDNIEDESAQQNEKITYEKKYENIDLNNEEYKKFKSSNMRKILELDDDKLKNLTKSEFQELINEVYSTGNIINKDLENKIIRGKNQVIDESQDENEVKSCNNITFINDIEISLNPEEKLENIEEIVDDKDIPDFEQEEIKNQQNRTLFFEKEDFEKDFFPSIINFEMNEKDENKNIKNVDIKNNQS